MQRKFYLCEFFHVLGRKISTISFRWEKKWAIIYMKISNLITEAQINRRLSNRKPFGCRLGSLCQEWPLKGKKIDNTSRFFLAKKNKPKQKTKAEVGIIYILTVDISRAKPVVKLARADYTRASSRNCHKVKEIRESRPNGQIENMHTTG